MKKLFLVLLAVGMIGLPLFAGGGKQSAQKSGGPVFGYITQSLEFDWCKSSADAFQYACAQKGVRPIIMDPQNNLEKAMSQFEDLINQKVDGISIYTLTPELDKQMADRARQAGIPVVFENGLPSADTDYIACVACQYDDIGYAAMEYVSKKYPGAKIFYVQGAPGMGVLEEYMIGVEKGLKAFTNISMVEKQPTDWGAEQALNVTQNVIQSGKQFDVIFANNEQMATGVVVALKDAGLMGKVKVIATGGSPQGLEAIQKGELDATMSAPVCIQGVTTFKNLWMAVNGQTPKKFTPLPILPIDKSNLGDAMLWTSYDKAFAYIGGIN
ncbi:MAG: sugar ABC transporter substrate-binding protein [Treponema sp.]|jgi:ABC-type sugar transport system substrate-binding protein|nr:sugar ABC transporter substrate-binding protein [Treponema sp.]